ncbi:hypothetical protein PHAVU_003G008200 [Phaseolus vulgaris]|uniref:Uncharacterized protein n=1 Tax=Phaseolus vulgaris TaxID=3885 RepID=V7C4K7_PHAVU|nr:hypothetical protein PHAVU_003G008200g [Phaseolus vulgaris]ESW25112.1 hypothetical protein PHAVU_003G008200g [Phaseolus vulgaris]
MSWSCIVLFCFVLDTYIIHTCTWFQICFIRYNFSLQWYTSLMLPINSHTAPKQITSILCIINVAYVVSLTQNFREFSNHFAGTIVFTRIFLRVENGQLMGHFAFMRLDPYWAYFN